MYANHQLQEFNAFVNYKGKALLYFVCNIDAIITDKFKKVFRHLTSRIPNYGVVIDEATSIKSMRADRTQEAFNIGNMAMMRRILTGTPIVQSPLDLYSQAHFLKPGILGYTNYYAFKTRYAEIRKQFYGTRSFDKIVGFRDLDDLSNKVRNYASIIKLNECVDLPERVFKQVIVELTKEQKEAYEDLRDKAIAYIENHEVTVVNVLSMITRLLQIVAGQLKIREGVYVSIKNNRLDALKEQVDEVNDQCLIWCPYVRSAVDIVKFLKKEAAHVSSDYNIGERQEVIDSWRKGNFKCLVMNPQSASHGLTLTEASTSIYYTNGYNLEHRIQSLARNYRIGQTKKTLVTDLVSPGTLEPLVLKSLLDKQSLADRVVGQQSAKEIIGAS
jgi:Superfamily II DNA/RNA helicases, SNF2 family